MRLFLYWNSFCIIQGCLYLGELEEVELNSPPSIISSSPGLDGDMYLYADSSNSAQLNKSFVVVFDENDSENLIFSWWVDGSGMLGTAETIPGEDAGVFASQIDLSSYSENFSAWDGRELHFSVRDSFRSSTQLSWQIIVQEGN